MVRVQGVGINMKTTNELKELMGCSRTHVCRMAVQLGWERIKKPDGVWYYDITDEQLADYLKTRPPLRDDVIDGGLELFKLTMGWTNNSEKNLSILKDGNR